MFNKDIYIQRRNKLAQKVGTGLILLLGNDEAGMNFKNNWYPFRQDSTFLYYAGIDLAELAVIMDLDTGTTTLFGNELTIDDIVWTGPLPSLTELASSVGIDKVRPYKELETVLTNAKSKQQTIHFLPAYRPEHTLKLQAWLAVPPQESVSAASVSLIQAVVSMRSHKGPVEIAEMEKAVDISNDMHTYFMRAVAAGKNEMAIAGQLRAIAIAAGGDLSYPTILTSRGETLHIHARNLSLPAGAMALCDAGAETAMHYAGDLTRTAPISEKFTAIQKDMYQLILDIQLKTIDACRPGTAFSDVHRLSGQLLLEGLKSFNIIKGDTSEALNQDAHTLFFQCGLGHMIGLDVHDMENLGEQYVGYTPDTPKNMSFGWKSLRLGRALEPGFTITVEPGIYFIPTLIDLWKADNKLADFINYPELEKFKNFGGIRIEDNLVITENGYRILGSRMAAKTVAEMEALHQ